MEEKLREILLMQIEALEEQNSMTENVNLIAFNNGRIHQCQKTLHDMYVFSKDDS